ncbi:MAG: hypothetical protein GEU99_21145 [Luteitalea sp.]|nr:hypothetical protein [Luteitalea sp.]
MTRLQRLLRAEPGKPLLGVAAYFYDPIFIEIAARLGYDAAWIEMEHAPISFGEAADLCRIAQGLGLLTMIRVPDCRRESVLKAAECGPDIIDVPMANSPDVLRGLVAEARFAPLGARGAFSVSRAMHYGLVDSLSAAQQQINGELCLMVQIETREAAARAEELCAVDGVDIFIGPADLAASLGVPGEPGHPLVRQAATQIVAAARRYGKHVASAAGSADFAFWVDQGIDVLFCTNDIVALRTGAELALRHAKAAVAQRQVAVASDPGAPS